MWQAKAKVAGLLLSMGLLAIGQIPVQSSADKLVEIERIAVSGTRLPGGSLIALTGLKPHDKVNGLSVNAACHKITATGLFKTVDYSYDAYPDRPEVVLNLIVADESPLVQASFKPAVDENAIWTSLQSMDPILTRQLPPTEKALAFYSKGIEKYLKANGRNNEYAAAIVTSDAKGNPAGVVFEIREYKSLAQNLSSSRFQ